MTPQQLNAWIVAGSALVNVIGLAYSEFLKIMGNHDLSIEEQNQILTAIIEDANRRRLAAEAASTPPPQE